MKKHLFILFTLIFSFSQAISAQTRTVSGTVHDGNGIPIPGANIIISGTTLGSITNNEGEYSMEINAKAKALVFSFVGYAKQTIEVGDQTNINVVLQPTFENLDEVLVIGYGTSTRSDLTSSVASVDIEELQKRATASMDQALQGLTAGVLVVNNNATPGGGASVRIRGIGGINNSEPLYVIDGVPIAVNANENTSPMSLLNPNDIESIEILKDAASAAIYGARAANGVVLITTKRGQVGKATVSYNGYYGAQTMVNPLKQMNSEQWTGFMNQAFENAGDPAPFGNPSSYGVGTDWVNEITRSGFAAPIQDHQLTMSGGDTKGTFLISLGYFDQVGVVKGTDFKRFSVRMNGDRQINKLLKIGANMNVNHREQNRYTGSRENYNGLIAKAYRYYPTVEPFDENGDYNGPPAESIYKPHDNPLFVAEQFTFRPVNTQFMSNIYAELQILPSLTFKSSAALTYNALNQFQNTPKYEMGILLNPDNVLAKTQAQGYNWLIENVLSFSKSFGKHNVQALLGQSVQNFSYESIYTKTAYPENGYWVTSESGTQVEINNIIQEHSLASFFGRAFYNFDDRYLLTGTLRADGSSRFGDNNKWGVFPSFSAAWRVSQEDFFADNDVLTSFKLRGGWGQVGANEIGNYEYSVAIASGFYYPFGGYDGVRYTGSAPASIANPDIKWETGSQYNFGGDFGFFNGRINLVVEYFSKTFSDMLIGVPVSAVSGISSDNVQGSVTQNIAKVNNQGVEIDLDFNGNAGDFQYSIGVNFTTYNNNVISLGGADELFAYSLQNNFWTRTYVGGELGEFYGYEYDGIFQNQSEIDGHALQEAGTAPGDFRFKDISGPDGSPDSIIDDNDLTSIGSPVPDFIFGLNANLSYKWLDFSMQFSGSFGNKIYNVTKYSMMDNTFYENKLAEYEAWDGEGSTDIWPRAHNLDPNDNSRRSSYFVEDGSYLRCTVMQLGYTLPSRLSSKMHMSRLRIYTSVLNLFTITNYSGVDPEVGNFEGSNLSAGIDAFVYPIYRTMLFGINISF